MKSELMALAGRIRRIVSDLEQVVRRAESLMHKAKQTGDDGYLDGVALNLHGFYSGAERLFEDIARTLEKALPAGAGWHQDLLLQMSAEVPSIRPPVLRRRSEALQGEVMLDARMRCHFAWRFRNRDDGTGGGERRWTKEWTAQGPGTAQAPVASRGKSLGGVRGRNRPGPTHAEPGAHTARHPSKTEAERQGEERA